MCLPIISPENWKPATKTDQGNPESSWGYVLGGGEYQGGRDTWEGGYQGGRDTGGGVSEEPMRGIPL